MLTGLRNRSRGTAARAACAAAALALACAGGAAFAAAPGAASASAATVTDVFAAVGEGRFAEAGEIAAALDATAGHGPLLATFVGAAQAASAGDCAAALGQALAVIRQSPLFLPAYDIAAGCLAADGRPGEGAALYDAAAARLPDSPDRAMLLDRARALRPDLSPILSLEGSAQPSTNLNRSTTADGFNGWIISDAAQAQAGLAASIAARLEKPLHVSPRLYAAASLKAGLQYDSISGDVRPLAEAALTFRRMLTPATSIGLTLAHEHILDGAETFSARPNARLELHHTASAAWSFSARADVAYTDHQNDSLDGWTAGVGASVAWLARADDRLVAGFRVEREERATDSNRHTELALDAEWEHAFAGGLITSLGTQLVFRLHDDTAALSFDRQRDTALSGSIGLSHRDLLIGGLRPALTYTYTRQWSNDVFSDFDAHDVAIRVKAAF